MRTHCYYVLRERDDRLRWHYAPDGIAPATALHVATSLALVEEWISREEAVARARAADQRHHEDQGDLFGGRR